MSTDAEQATRLLADIVGRYLAQLHVSAGDVQLLLDGGTLVRLAGTTRLGDGAAVEEPQSLPGLALLLPLLNEEVQSAVVAPDGTLAVTFAAGALTCRPGEAYEAWEFRKESGAMVVCMPGGDLAIWSDQRQVPLVQLRHGDDSRRYMHRRGIERARRSDPDEHQHPEKGVT